MIAPIVVLLLVAVLIVFRGLGIKPDGTTNGNHNDHGTGNIDGD